MGEIYEKSNLYLLNFGKNDVKEVAGVYLLPPWVLLGSNLTSVTWQQSCQCHFGKIVPITFANNRASVTWEQLIDSFTVAIVTWEQSYQSHLGTIVQVLLENNRAGVTWKESCQLPKACNFIKKRVSGKGVFPWILQNF